MGCLLVYWLPANFVNWRDRSGQSHLLTGAQPSHKQFCPLLGPLQSSNTNQTIQSSNNNQALQSSNTNQTIQASPGPSITIQFLLWPRELFSLQLVVETNTKQTSKLANTNQTNQSNLEDTGNPLEIKHRQPQQRISFFDNVHILAQQHFQVKGDWN